MTILKMEAEETNSDNERSENTNSDNVYSEKGQVRKRKHLEMANSKIAIWERINLKRTITKEYNYEKVKPGKRQFRKGNWENQFRKWKSEKANS